MFGDEAGSGLWHAGAAACTLSQETLHRNEIGWPTASVTAIETTTALNTCHRVPPRARAGPSVAWQPKGKVRTIR